MYCTHKKMQSTARIDYCPDCKYEFYYGDAHAEGERRFSRLINLGKNNPNPLEDDMKINYWQERNWFEEGY